MPFYQSIGPIGNKTEPVQGWRMRRFVPRAVPERRIPSRHRRLAIGGPVSPAVTESRFIALRVALSH